jgi:hypothetical protein
MINLSRIVLGRNKQSFTVYRKTGQWAGGRWQESENPITLEGTIVPDNPKDLDQVPEGDRVKGIITVYCPQQIYTTHAISDGQQGAGTSDQIEWHSERYRVYSTQPFIDYGFYKAIGIRMVSE